MTEKYTSKEYKVYTFEEMQDLVASFGKDDRVVIAVSIHRGGRVDSYTTSHDYPVNDYNIAREHFSEHLHSMRHQEMDKVYGDVTQNAKVNDEAQRILDMLE